MEVDIYMVYSETYNCDIDGEFEWKCRLPNKFCSGKMTFCSDNMLNCKNFNIFKDYYIFELECPKCHKKYYIRRDKEAKE